MHLKLDQACLASLTAMRTRIVRLGNKNGEGLGEDLYQEIWITLLNLLKNERNPQPASWDAYIYRISQRTLAKLLSRKKRHGSMLLSIESDQRRYQKPDPAFLAEQKDLLFKVEDYFEKKPEYREILPVFRGQETCLQAALRLKSSVETIRTRKKRVRKALRREFLTPAVITKPTQTNLK